MKISSSAPNHFFVSFNEARGIAENKKKILRKKDSRCFTYFQTNFINTILLFIIELCFVLYFKLSLWYLLFSLIPLLVKSIYVVLYLRERKIYQARKYNIIDEKGLHDDSFYGIKMLFEWKKIKALVIAKHCVVILTDTPCYFYYDISKKKELIEVFEENGCKKKIIY